MRLGRLSRRPKRRRWPRSRAPGCDQVQAAGAGAAPRPPPSVAPFRSRPPRPPCCGRGSSVPAGGRSARKSRGSPAAALAGRRWARAGPGRPRRRGSGRCAGLVRGAPTAGRGRAGAWPLRRGGGDAARSRRGRDALCAGAGPGRLRRRGGASRGEERGSPRAASSELWDVHAETAVTALPLRLPQVSCKRKWFQLAPGIFHVKQHGSL